MSTITRISVVTMLITATIMIILKMTIRVVKDIILTHKRQWFLTTNLTTMFLNTTIPLLHHTCTQVQIWGEVKTTYLRARNNGSSYNHICEIYILFIIYNKNELTEVNVALCGFTLRYCNSEINDLLIVSFDLSLLGVCMFM